MAYEVGGAIAPGNLGVTLTNGSADVDRYNIFIVTVSVTFSGGGTYTCPLIYSRGSGTVCQCAIVRHSNSTDYWIYWQLALSTRTFSVPLVRAYNAMAVKGWNGSGSVTQIRGVV